jgi:hypothetical protein
MPRLRFTMFDAAMFVALIAGSIAIHRTFFVSQVHFPKYICLGAYLVFVATATVGAIFSRPAARPPFVGMALAGWLYFVFVFHAGFGNGLEGIVWTTHTQLGVALSLLAGLASYLVGSLFGKTPPN